MAEVRFDHVTKRFGDFTALKDFDLTIEDREFLVLVGPSGCGKSTALRMLAGLETITEGSIHIGDRRVNGVPAKDRDIAMVFQSYALYPHMTVYDNIAFGLRLRKTPKRDLDRKVRDAATTLGVDSLLDRKPGQLSGGQRQRVAVARAIVREPSVFLLDEPLSNLDAKLRVHTRAEISKLHERLGTTFVYVTHDQVEAMTMADRIAVMHEGVIQQVGSPQELYDHPVNVFVAGFIGSPAMNFFDAEVVENGSGVSLQGEGFEVDVPDHRADDVRPYLGRRMRFGIRPENIHDTEYVPSGIPVAPTTVTVEVTEPMGNEVFLHLMAGRTKLLARVDPRTAVEEGDSVEVVIDMERMHVFDPDTERSLRTVDPEASTA